MYHILRYFSKIIIIKKALMSEAQEGEITCNTVKTVVDIIAPDAGIKGKKG